MYLRILILLFAIALSVSLQASGSEGMWDIDTKDQPIFDYYTAKGSAAMGSPFDGGSGVWVYNKWGMGPVQDYNGGLFGRMMVCNSSKIDPQQAYSVRGDFYAALLNNYATLEFPLSDQFSTGTGLKQYFEGGYLTWTEASGVVMTAYDNKLIIDNTNSGFTKTGSWFTYGTFGAYGGSCFRHACSPGSINKAQWSFPITQPGFYDVYVRYPEYITATTKATYNIQHSTGTTDVFVDQHSDFNGRSSRWNHLGCFQFSASGAKIILLTKGPSGNVLADAVRIIGPIPEQETPALTTPVVTDDGTFTADQNLLHCRWSSPDQNISSYEYCVGTSPLTSDIVSPTNIGTATQVWVTGLNLTADQTYYITVKSYDSSGAQSNSGCSDGIIYKSATQASSIIDALELPNTTRVILKGKKVSALFANRFYITETDSSRGIAINSANSLPANSLCDISGTLDILEGERVITLGCVTPCQP